MGLGPGGIGPVGQRRLSRQTACEQDGLFLEGPRLGPRRPGVVVEQAGEVVDGPAEPADWKAQWIGVAPQAGQPKNDPWFRKTFSTDRPAGPRHGLRRFARDITNST